MTDAEMEILTLIAKALAADIAVNSNIPIGLAICSLFAIPDNLLTLLDSPQGWTALAGFVSADLGAPPPDYCPVLH